MAVVAGVSHVLSFPHRGTETWGNQCLQRDLYPVSNFHSGPSISCLLSPVYPKILP